MNSRQRTASGLGLGAASLFDFSKKAPQLQWTVDNLQMLFRNVEHGWTAHFLAANLGRICAISSLINHFKLIFFLQVANPTAPLVAKLHDHSASSKAMRNAT